jgi:hypothetical protein
MRANPAPTEHDPALTAAPGRTYDRSWRQTDLNSQQSGSVMCVVSLGKEKVYVLAGSAGRSAPDS